jgi:hypothetical protein
MTFRSAAHDSPSRPAVRVQAVLTPLWRGGVACMALVMLLLLQKAQLKLKNERDERSIAKAV